MPLKVQHIAVDLADKTIVMHFNLDMQKATDAAIEREIRRAGLTALKWRRITPDEATAISRKLRGLA